MKSVFLFPIILSLLMVVPLMADAHQSGCHAWHSCPSDDGSYVCGDTGHDNYCPTNTKLSLNPLEDKIYRENDSLIVSGKVVYNPEIPFVVSQIFNPSNGWIVQTIEQVKSDGTFSFDFYVKEYNGFTTNGTYTARTTFEDEWQVQTFTYEKPAPPITSLIIPPVILGNTSAPVTILQYGDYGERFSKRFYDDTEKQIREKYVDTGKVKFFWQDFGLSSINPNQPHFANAALCAGEEEKYWEYHDQLFDKFDSLKNNTVSLETIARDLDLYLPNWNECITEKRYDSHTANNIAPNGEQLSGVPSFFISNSTHNVILSGAQPFETFEEVIDRMLNMTNSESLDCTTTVGLDIFQCDDFDTYFVSSVGNTNTGGYGQQIPFLNPGLLPNRLGVADEGNVGAGTIQHVSQGRLTSYIDNSPPLRETGSIPLHQGAMLEISIVYTSKVKPYPVLEHDVICALTEGQTVEDCGVINIDMTREDIFFFFGYEPIIDGILPPNVKSYTYEFQHLETVYNRK